MHKKQIHAQFDRCMWCGPTIKQNEYTNKREHYIQSMRINERVPNKSNELHSSMDIGHILKSHCQMSWYGICLSQHKWTDSWTKIVIFILNGISSDSSMNWSHFAPITMNRNFSSSTQAKWAWYLKTTYNVVIFQLKVYPSKLVCVNTYSCAPQTQHQMWSPLNGSFLYVLHNTVEKSNSISSSSRRRSFRKWNTQFKWFQNEKK